MTRRRKPAAPAYEPPWSLPPGVSVLEWGDREGWLLARGKDVTASVVAALWDAHPYVTLLELWHQKRGTLRGEPRARETEAMMRGRIFERAAVDMLRERHPDWSIHWTADKRVYFRDPEARLGATPDVLVDHPERGRGIIQIKTTGRRQFQREWVDEDGQPEAPMWISLQATLERHLVGASWAAVAPLVIDEWFSLSMPILDVPEVDGLFETMKSRAARFWRDVAEGVEPPANYARDGGLIERIYREASDDELDWTGDEEIARLLDERAAALADRRDADGRLTRIDAEIKHRLGDAQAAHIGRGRVIRWNNERRAGRMMPPTNSRVLRIP